MESKMERKHVNTGCVDDRWCMDDVLVYKAARLSLAD